nr:bZIP transcription factor 17 [Cryptomonas curvata]
MNIETNNMHIEKNFCLSHGISRLDSWKKENIFEFTIYTKIFHSKFFKNSKNINIIYIERNISNYKTIDFYWSNRHHFQYQTQYENFLNLNEKNLEHFLDLNINNSFSTKRRRRRKFLTDDERRIARILKNRRTAEESRQRRIQKMKQLENYVILSEEREKKLREEISYLAKENAVRTVELILIKKNFTEF